MKHQLWLSTLPTQRIPYFIRPKKIFQGYYAMINDHTFAETA